MVHATSFKNCKYVQFQNILSMEFKSGFRSDFSLSTPNLSPSDIVTEQISGGRALSLLSDRDIQWRFFPHGWIRRDWEPYRLATADLQSIVDTTPAVFASFDACEPVLNAQHCKAISFGCGYSVPKGFSYQIDYHSDKVDLLSEHLVRHTETARRLYTHGECHITLHFSRRFDGHEIKSAIGMLGLGLEIQDPSVVHLAGINLKSLL